MQIKILATLWGHESQDITTYCHRIKEAGYDGIDAWLPDDAGVRKKFFDVLEKEELILITHQHQAHGADFETFKRSFLDYLEFSAQGGPILMNCHTGKDYFTFQQNLELIDIAAAFSARTGLTVAHETHRGRVGYHPAEMQGYFDARRELVITADLSHWVCTTESFLENFAGTVNEAIARTRHIHARVGFEEGPQVPDPRAPEWKLALDHFFGWWDRMVEGRRRSGQQVLTFTTEFGPVPYLPTIPFRNVPVADQFEINSFMKDMLRQRYILRGPI
jgi:sugar phosphate isomerase/epimerase